MLNTPLLVKRRLSTGVLEWVGRLAEDKRGVYFQYDADYLARRSSSLAPFNLAFDASLQAAPRQPHAGLHGVFADSLPDGWGLYLMDKQFRQHGYAPQHVTSLERLAFTGQRGAGALCYEPEQHFDQETEPPTLDLLALGQAAMEVFEGGESELISHLITASGSGGARPKLNVTQQADGLYSSHPQAEGRPLLIKLSSEKFALQHHESLVEYVYMQLAQRAGIEVADFALLEMGQGRYWLQQARFDCVGTRGRQHMISAAGLLDASFREPALDYVDLIKASRILCGVPAAQQLLRRALFNYLMLNQDDHAKNFAFLADDQDQWRLAPAYDLLYTPSMYQQHMTSFDGHGAAIPPQALAHLAGQAGLAGGSAVLKLAEELYNVVRDFHLEAKQLALPKVLIQQIQQDIDQKWQSLPKKS